MDSKFRLASAGVSHPGRVRTHNEDVILVRDDLQLYAVADGAGGHNAGEVASALAARSMSNYVGATVRQAWSKPVLDRFGVHNGGRRLAAAIRKANQDVYQIAHSSSRYEDMVTTIVAMQFSAEHGLVHVAHVGDSRCYRLRACVVELLTTDHSLLMELLEREPDVDDTLLAKMPRNVVTRALGLEEHPRISFRSMPALPGDRYLVCSDGLSGMVTLDDLEAALNEPSSPHETADALIKLAIAGGGRDNVSVVVVDVMSDDELLDVDAELPAGVTAPQFDSQPPELEVVENDPAFDGNVIERIQQIDALSPELLETLNDVIKRKT